MDRQTRSGVIRERETCAAEGEGRRQGHLRKTNVLQKKIIIQIKKQFCVLFLRRTKVCGTELGKGTS